MQRRAIIKHARVRIDTSERFACRREGVTVPSDGKTIGEIVVRGNVVMEGYFRDPEATQRAMEGGWFHSGDAAVVHPDGYVEIRDRLKDVIISGGENISSIEIEGAMLRHPDVQEVAIVGLRTRSGARSDAFVVLKRTAKNRLTSCDLRARHLAHLKRRTVSRSFRIAENGDRKVQKYVLRGGRAAIAKQ